MNDQFFDEWPIAEIHETDDGKYRPCNLRKVPETAFLLKRKEVI